MKTDPNAAGDRTARTYRGTPPATLLQLLDSLARTGDIKASCAAAGVGRRTFYDVRDSDLAFALAVARALDSARRQKRKPAAT